MEGQYTKLLPVQHISEKTCTLFLACYRAVVRTIKIKPIGAYLPPAFVAIDTVLELTADLYSIPVNLLIGRRAEWRIEWPRMVARAVAVELGSCKATVASELKCDRGSVNYAIRSVQAAREAYPKVDAEIKALIERIKQQHP